jgi:hypothetical protein
MSYETPAALSLVVWVATGYFLGAGKASGPRARLMDAVWLAGLGCSVALAVYLILVDFNYIAA